MPASTDYFTHVGSPGTATTLSAPGHSIAGTSITVVSTANWPTDTAVIFAIDTFTLVNGVATRNVGSYTEFEGVVTSATTIGSLVLRYGTDQTYPAGSTTRVYIPVASSRENRLVDGLLIAHDQDGTLKAGAVDNAAALASNVVTTGKILNANVTADKLGTGAAAAYVATVETRSANTYGQLTTTTDAVTVTIGANGLALVNVSSYIQGSLAASVYSISVDITGGTTAPASDIRCIDLQPYTNNAREYKTGTWLLTGLAAGSTTFKMMYKASSGTGTFQDRRISVVPL